MNHQKRNDNGEKSQIEELVHCVSKDREMLGNMLQVKLNFYPQSLKKLEQRINEWYPEGEREVAPHMAVIIGVYLGETIRRNIEKSGVKAVWQDGKDGDIFDTSLLIYGVATEEEGHDSTLMLKPLLRAYKFINQDRTDSMYAMYVLLQDMCHGRINSHPDKKWRQTPRGYQYRVMKTDE